MSGDYYCTVDFCGIIVYSSGIDLAMLSVLSCQHSGDYYCTVDFCGIIVYSSGIRPSSALSTIMSACQVITIVL